MKTLILLLTAAMSAPAFAQSGYESETTRTTTNSSPTATPGSVAPMTNETTPMDDTTSGALTDRSGSSTSDTDYNNYNTESGSSSTSDLSNSSDTGTTYDRGTTYESGSSTMTPSTESTPSATAPATMAPTTTTSETTTSRTYREDTGAERVHGGFYIEPGIVGTREDADIKSGLGSDTTGTANSVAFDLKLGAHINDMFFAGLDGRYGRSSFEDSSYQNVDATTWNWGPTIGANAPYFGGRVWASYILEGNYDPDQGANNVDLRFRDPYGWRVGGGIRLSSVSLNLEYQDLTYRTTDLQSAGSVALNDSGIDFAQRGYALSLSFPIDL